MAEAVGSSPTSSTITLLIEPTSKDPRSRQGAGVLAFWGIVLARMAAGVGFGVALTVPRRVLWKARSSANGPANSALVMVSSQM